MNSFAASDSKQHQAYQQQLLDRKNKANYVKLTDSIQQAELTILTSSTDLGVAYNGGRRGAQFGAELLLKQFMALSNPPISTLFTHECSKAQLEASDFTAAQQQESIVLAKYLSPTSLIHIGGGHDHIYPLLKAIHQQYPQQTITIVNIDAHLDTRTDQLPHSGTPFRQFLAEVPETQLLQIGIDKIVNPQDHFNGLDQQMSVLFQDELLHEKVAFTKQIKDFLPANADIVVISLDCDALSSSTMSAVSATSYKGLEYWQVATIFNISKQLSADHYLGIYEFNPLYDSLGGASARTVISLMRDYLT